LASGANAHGRFSLGRFGGYNSNNNTFLNNNADAQSVHSIMGPADALFAGPREKLMNKLKVFNNMKMNSI
jgi:hypothetical protein